MRLRLLSLLGALVLLQSAIGPVLADDLTDAQQKQDNANRTLTQSQLKERQLQQQKSQTEAQLASLQSTIAAKEQELRDDTARLDQLQGQIDDNQRDSDNKKAEKARAQEELKIRARSLYKSGGDITLLDSVFNASSFAEVANRFLAMSEVTRADQELIARIKDAQATIEKLGAELAQKKADQQAVKDRKQAEADQLNGMYARESAYKNQLGQQIRSQEQLQAEARRQAAQASAEIAAIVEARKRAHSSGIFAWPGVQGPITQGFGCTDYSAEPYPPPGYSCPPKRPYFHTGIDIGGPYGSEVDSADGGIAYTYVSNYGYGLHIIVVHQNGFATIYGHLSRFAIADGQAVGKGEAIGYEGSTGNSSGPHLHFEVRLNNVPQDPCRYVGC
jgi:murein DD-endopeptidase MepM/ murein hydrolase activator NlpD